MNSEAVAYILYLIIGLTAVLSFYWIIARVPGRRLASDIASLGTLKGKTINEIIKVAGPPTSSGSYADGGHLLEWRARGYHIALKFDANHICQRENHEPTQKPNLPGTMPAPVQPGLISKGSPPVTVEKASINTPKESIIVKTPTDFKKSTTTPVQTKPATRPDTSPLAGIENSPKSIAFQTTDKPPIEYQQSVAPPIQSVPKTPIVEATTDFVRPMTTPMESPPKELQNIFCDNCGDRLEAEAKFCDKCGEAVTQRPSVPSTDGWTTPPNDLQGMTHVIRPAVSVTDRSKPATSGCENCGRQLQDSDKFCDKCGAHIQLRLA